jgi:DNA-directed RNA polymerase specialized sigma24 family protein
VETVPVADLVERIRGGDEEAWEDLVERYVGLVHATCRGHGLDDAAAAEVSEVVWLRLADHLGDLRSSDLIGCWVAAVARRECLRRQRGRGEPAAAGLDAGLLAGEREQAVVAAFGRLSPDCRRLLRVAAAPGVTDDEVAAALDVPAGDVAGARDACLGELERLLG